MPAFVHDQREQMSRQLIVYGFAERASPVWLDAASRVARAGWDEFTHVLVDAMVGMWMAPWTPTASDAYRR